VHTNLENPNKHENMYCIFSPFPLEKIIQPEKKEVQGTGIGF